LNAVIIAEMLESDEEVSRGKENVEDFEAGRGKLRTDIEKRE